MIPYLLLLLLPSMFALFNTRRLSLTLWSMTFVVYVLFVGFRDQVGPDWAQYMRIHDSLAYAEFWDIATRVEPLSHLLFWFSETSGYENYLSNVVAAFIMMIGVFSFARRTPNPWLALIAATPYFIIVIGMSGIRQAMAAGVVLFLLSRWEKYSFVRRGAYILMAGLFHTSALVNNIFLIVRLDIALRYKIVLGTVVGLATVYLGTQVSVYADNVANYQRRYVEGYVMYQSFGSLYHIGMVAIPAFLGVIYKKRIAHAVHNVALLHFGLYAAIAVTLINLFSSTVASRLTVYLYFVPMMIYPAFAASVQGHSRLGIVGRVIIFHIFILIGWFSLGNVAQAYMPYHSLLLDD